jgi:hypothetical protein
MPEWRLYVKKYVVSFFSYLWRTLSFIWLTLILGIVISTLSTWLITPEKEFVNSAPFFRWVVEHFVLTIIILLLLEVDFIQI